jgi:tight adherence protein C
VDALRHLHERTGLEDVGALVTVLGQAERYGSHVAEALRTHAQLTRARRLLEAERRACEATPKLTVVMIIFVLPPLFIVVLGPTIVNLAERFGAMMGG